MRRNKLILKFQRGSADPVVHFCEGSGVLSVFSRLQKVIFIYSYSLIYLSICIWTCMEAVGTEVVAVIFPVVAIVCAAVYYYWDAIKLNFNILAGRNVAAPEVPVNEHPLYG